MTAEELVALKVELESTKKQLQEAALHVVLLRGCLALVKLEWEHTPQIPGYGMRMYQAALQGLSVRTKTVALVAKFEALWATTADLMRYLQTITPLIQSRAEYVEVEKALNSLEEDT